VPHNLHNAVVPGHPSKDQTGETDGVESGVQDGCNNTAHPHLMMISVVCTLDSALLNTFFLVDVMWPHSNDCCLDPRLEWWTQVSFPITAFELKPQLPVLLVQKINGHFFVDSRARARVCVCARVCVRVHACVRVSASMASKDERPWKSQALQKFSLHNLC